jgi:hypothetical protein
MRIPTLVAVVVVGLSLLVLPADGQSADPWIGTWKLNTAKSKYNPGLAPKSSTLTIVAAEGGFRQTIDTVPRTLGLPTRSEVLIKFDGKDSRVKGNPNADTSAYTKFDSRTYVVVSKKDGKVTLTSQVVISADGKTRTVIQTGTNALGQKVNNTIVYDRQ